MEISSQVIDAEDFEIEQVKSWIATSKPATSQDTNYNILTMSPPKITQESQLSSLVGLEPFK